jgi:small conductance mechanosensitive channel
VENLVNYVLDQATVWLPKVIKIVVIFLVFFILAKIIKRIINAAGKRLQFDQNIVSLLARTSSIIIIIFGIITVIGTLGVNVSALIAGLGLSGFALGFALKDSISNLLSGVLILLYRPFRAGDRIKILAYEGTVISIDLRYTELETDGTKVLIPNSKLITDPITVLQ